MYALVTARERPLLRACQLKCPLNNSGKSVNVHYDIILIIFNTSIAPFTIKDQKRFTWQLDKTMHF